MPRGFGVPQQKKRSNAKTALNEVQQLRKPAASEPESVGDIAIQAEIEVAIAQLHQEHAEELALAWAIGVYNPLGDADPAAARALAAEEEAWLYLAWVVGWLQVEADLDAIYCTAPPPDFAVEQADWYLRPDLTSFLEQPERLCDVVQKYPIPLSAIQAAVARFGQQLGWTSGQRSQTFLELLGKPEAELSEDDWKFLAFELQSRL